MNGQGATVPAMTVEVLMSRPWEIGTPHRARTTCPHGGLERSYRRICPAHGCHKSARRAQACERTNPSLTSLVGLALYMHEKRLQCDCPFYWMLRKGATHVPYHKKPGLVPERMVHQTTPPGHGGVFMMRLVHGHVIHGARLLTEDERQLLRGAS